MIISVISTIKEIIFETILILFLLSLVLIGLLQDGVLIERIAVGPVVLDQLYLKLDKKLVVQIHHLTLPLPQGDTFPIREKLKLLKVATATIDSLTIRQLTIGSYQGELSYSRNRLRFNSPSLRLEASFLSLLPDLYFILHQLQLPDYGLRLQGRGKLDRTGHLRMGGSYTFHGAPGSYWLEKGKGKLTWTIRSHPFDQRVWHHLITQLLPPSQVSWPLKIEAEEYQIPSLTITILEGKAPHIQGHIQAKGVQLPFHPELPPVTIARLDGTIDGDRLSCVATGASFQEKRLSKLLAQVDSRGVHLSLQLDTPIDRQIQTLLAAYGIHLPCLQEEGRSQVEVNLQIPWTLQGLQIAGALKGRGKVVCGDGVPLTSRNFRLRLRSQRLLLLPSQIELLPFQGRIQGVLDLKQGIGRYTLANFRSDPTFPLIHLPPTTTPLEVDLQNQRLLLPHFQVSYSMATKRLTIHNLPLLAPYLPWLPPLREGNLTINLAKGQGQWNAILTHPIFSRNGIPISPLHGTIHLAKSRGSIGDFATIHLGPKPQIDLNDITIDLKELAALLPAKGGKRATLTVTLTRTSLTYQDHSLFIQSGTLQLGPHFHFLGYLPHGFVTIEERGKGYRFRASALSSQELNALLGFPLVDRGRYEVEGVIQDGVVEGKLHIAQGTLRHLTKFNNLFALFNTIPALLTLSSPGFAAKGLPIQEGEIAFQVSSNYLFFPSIHLRSKAMTIRGSGAIDRKGGNVAFLLEIETLKGLAHLVHKIPVAGYILLGKKGTITTRIEVRGSLERPQVRSLLPQESLQLPFQILRRTLQLPFDLLAPAR
ncbi:MAG: hypothetical protein C6I00_02180 [Nitratiruptor sp.]|nr:hypothetical protein [Nitratiruptor sp.]NPA84096.1 DUF3971 domain-containing protein [Campylobacterota bacterium]